MEHAHGFLIEVAVGVVVASKSSDGNVLGKKVGGVSGHFGLYVNISCFGSNSLTGRFVVILSCLVGTSLNS